MKVKTINWSKILMSVAHVNWKLKTCYRLAMGLLSAFPPYCTSFFALVQIQHNFYNLRTYKIFISHCKFKGQILNCFACYASLHKRVISNASKYFLMWWTLGKNTELHFRSSRLDSETWLEDFKRQPLKHF